ncbi:hypothetical protein Tco_0226534 [Tanacetum coccineum]
MVAEGEGDWKGNDRWVVIGVEGKCGCGCEGGCVELDWMWGVGIWGCGRGGRLWLGRGEGVNRMGVGELMWMLGGVGGDG